MQYRIRPSSLALTVACNASMQLQESVPPLPETEEEAEGHAAHWVARRFIAGFGHELPVNAKFQYGGKEWTVDADMYAGAVMYARALGGVHPDLHPEETLPVRRVHTTECGGTPDGYRYFPDARAAYQICPPGIDPERFTQGRIKIIRVGDYKYGHRYVEVFESYQLGSYVTAVADKYNLNDNDEDLYVELILVQPRSYHIDGPVRIWRTKLVNLRALINVASNAAHHALVPLNAPNAPQATTGRHCIDCKARHVCGALQRNTMHLVDYSHAPERVELPPWALGQELMIVQDAIKQLEAREQGLAAQAEAVIRAGHPVPMYHMEPGRSVLSYYDNVNTDELVGFGDLVGIDLRKKLQRKDQVVTPTQAIQLGIDETAMRSYAHRPPGTMRLARDNSINARKVFSK
jgi:hypothetical protein